MVASGRRYLRRGGSLGGLRLPPYRATAATAATDALPALGVAARTAGCAPAGGAPFVVLGGIVSTYLAVAVLTHPIGVTPHPHCLAYQTGVQHEIVWAVLYIVAVIGPALMSVLVLVHMVRRRRLPDPHRYHGVALLPPVPTPT
jgi:hypothetical protein